MKASEHGTWRGYQLQKCRCDACVLWQKSVRRKKPGIDDVENERPMSLAEKIAEIEWIGTTDGVENIAKRLGWANVDNMLRSLHKVKRLDLVEKLLARRDHEWNRFDEE